MKIILALFLFAAPCSAQILPMAVKDRATNDNLEWLYEQIQRIISGGLTGSYASVGHTHGDSTLTDLAASKLTGALPAIDGSALTNMGRFGGVFQLDAEGNITPDDIMMEDSIFEVVGNDIMPI